MFPCPLISFICVSYNADQLYYILWYYSLAIMNIYVKYNIYSCFLESKHGHVKDINVREKKKRETGGREQGQSVNVQVWL